ncbi:MAG TPA: hypothetical protein VK083_10535 [Nocardia sp.]|uniref:hypothetical protein n=1 Tax=Nocardia sp. TaxID=1821 RepID=UPI002B4AC208|nr:hypothetical protein [Nocardia sp.]HLS77215.1 hypothetical protein [Nocardia sp.]
MATRSVPQPPFSTELLADLHADNVEPELAARLWPAVRADADAARYLSELDEVTVRVRALGAADGVLHPMPRDVAERLTAFVESLGPVPLSPADADSPVGGTGTASRDEHSAVPGEDPTERLTGALPRPPFADAPSADAHPAAATHPDPAVGPTARPATATALRPRRRPAVRWIAAAAAALAVLAGAGIGVGLRGSGGDSAPPVAQPTPTTAAPSGDSLDTAAALSALGRHEVRGPLGDDAALAACVRAAGLERPVLGSMNFTYRGEEAVLILLAGPQPPKITALVVGPGCGADDPQVLDVTDIG